MKHPYGAPANRSSGSATRRRVRPSLTGRSRTRPRWASSRRRPASCGGRGRGAALPHRTGWRRSRSGSSR
eukprot:15438836-Alexandrium_andersonii.AAC.1